MSTKSYSKKDKKKISVWKRDLWDGPRNCLESLHRISIEKLKRILMKCKYLRCKIRKHLAYCEKHDAYYDFVRDEWLEPKCGWYRCGFCKNRPDKPSQVKK